jgi:hypothetical protein
MTALTYHRFSFPQLISIHHLYPTNHKAFKNVTFIACGLKYIFSPITENGMMMSVDQHVCADGLNSAATK